MDKMKKKIRRRNGAKTISTRYDYFVSIIKSPKVAPNALWTPWPVLLNVSYHKVYRYTWFMGGDLNGFPDSMSLIM